MVSLLVQQGSLAPCHRPSTVAKRDNSDGHKILYISFLLEPSSSLILLVIIINNSASP